ncbi:MAG: hypothetical protein NT166_02400 [Candidatus Aminicenantes bacterium]|nr:hypothetical protein [Candidatus Aminicenantes bacterium]
MCCSFHPGNDFTEEALCAYYKLKTVKTGENGGRPESPLDAFLEDIIFKKPVAAIIQKIEKYKDTGKYIPYFKDKAIPIGPLPLLPRPQGKLKFPQASRFPILLTLG